MTLTTTLRYNPHQIPVTELNQRVQSKYTWLRQRFPAMPQHTALGLACAQVQAELHPLPKRHHNPRRPQPLED